MKLGDLVDNIRRLEEAERCVAQAKTALQHGGNAHIMADKQKTLESAEAMLDRIRDEDVEC